MSATLDRAAPTARAQPSPQPTDLLRLVVWAAVYSIPGITALQPVSEYDTWWHLRTGQWIVEQHGIPATDPFTSFGAGKPWVAYSWLFGLALYGLYQSLGLTGIVLSRVLLALGVIAALHRLIARHCSSFAATAGLLAAAGVALTPLLVAERPGLITILFCTLTLDAVLALREGRATWAVWLLPVCYALWANIHVQFVHGLFLLGLAWAVPLVDHVLRRPTNGHADTWGTRHWWRLTTLGALCFLATCLNPYGPEIYSVVREYSRQKATYGIFAELKAMDFRELSDWFVLGLLGAAAYVLGRRGRLPTFDVLLLAAGAYFSFHAKHDLWFVVLAGCAVVAGRRVRCADQGERSAQRTLRPVHVAVLVGVMVLIVGSTRGLSEQNLRAQVAAEFPAAAVDYIDAHDCDGPLYNNVAWGGYLIWRLPRLPAAIDGRSNLHGDHRIQQFADTWAGKPGWDADPDLAAARLVVLERWATLSELLRRDPRFTVAYEDGLAVVFVRRDGPPRS
jgi:hypothetical protein